MVTIYNTTLSATSQRHFSDGLGGGRYYIAKNSIYLINTKPFVPEFQEQKAFVYSDHKLFPEITLNTIQNGKVNLH